MIFAFDQVMVHLRVKSAFYLHRSAREFDPAPAARHRIHAEALLLQPRGDLVQVLLRRPELRSILFRRKPRMVRRRLLVMLLIDELSQGSPLFVARLEHQHHSLHGGVSTYAAE